jgi:hypothetical protein
MFELCGNTNENVGQGHYRKVFKVQTAASDKEANQTDRGCATDLFEICSSRHDPNSCFSIKLFVCKIVSLLIVTLDACSNG